MNKLSRHTQMDHPDDVTAERNQDVFGHSSDSNYGFAFQVLG